MTGTSWTIADYNAVPDPHGRPIPAAPVAAAIPAAIPAAPIPEEGETDEPTIEEGETNFVCRVCSYFFVWSFSPRPGFPFSLSRFLIASIIFVFVLCICFPIWFSHLMFFYLLLSAFQPTRFVLFLILSISAFDFPTLCSSFRGSICFRNSHLMHCTVFFKQGLLLLFYSFKKACFFLFASSIRKQNHFKQKHNYRYMQGARPDALEEAQIAAAAMPPDA